MTKHSALLLVDIQYDFPEGGAALAVNPGKIDGERVLD
jgi:nicotinamidase-related amidase